MQKLYIVEVEHIQKMQELLDRKNHNEYFVLKEKNGFSDIVQYSKKYKNLHICTVSNEKMDQAKRIE